MSAAVQARRGRSSLDGLAMRGCQLGICCFARADPVFCCLVPFFSFELYRFSLAITLAMRGNTSATPGAERLS